VYIENDLEVDGTIYGNLSGTITPTGLTQGSITFIDGSGNLNEDNANIYWDDSNNRLAVGTSSATALMHCCLIFM